MCDYLVELLLRFKPAHHIFSLRFGVFSINVCVCNDHSIKRIVPKQVI